MTMSQVSHEFGALNTLLLVVVLGICILTTYLAKQNSVYYFPESAVAICLGLVIGGLVRIVAPYTAELDFLSFDPELFFFLFLPPIIFEAAYSLRKKDFFSNFWTISLFSVLGTVISTFIVGYLVLGFGMAGIVDIDTSSPLEALLFGSLISAIDPVATLSVMGNVDLKCNPLLYSLVFGESVLNDAVSVVLFKTFLQYYKSGAHFTNSSIPMFIADFIGITLASVLIGALTGLACCYLCKNTEIRKYPEFEIAILGLFAYGSYSMSEAIQLSGIMSLFFCGIVLSRYNSHNLSNISKVTAHTVFKSLGTLSELFVYLYIGMGVFTDRIKPWNVPFAIFSLCACIVGRFCNIFPLSFGANFCRREKIPFNMQTVMWFAGLRGAISFALSLNIPEVHRGVYVSTTLTIVLFTTLVFGPLTEPVLNWTDMRSKRPAPLDYETMSSTDHGYSVAGQDSPERDTLSTTISPFQKFEEEVMIPLFGGTVANPLSDNPPSPDISPRRISTISVEMV